MSKVFVSKINGKLKERLLEGLEWIEWKKIIRPDSRIFIKPNFTYPFYKPGVTTSPEIIETVVEILKSQNSNIIIGESDGGSYAWKAEEAFRGHNLYEISKKYGVEIVNLSKIDSEYIETEVDGRKIGLRLPAFLLHEIDAFITIPVPKTHVMTGASLGFKNQWGCIPEVMRLRYHYQFNEEIVAINKILRPKIVIFDGKYFLDRKGPMEGDSVPMDLLIVSNDLGAGDFISCQIMDINPNKISHFKIAKREGMFPSSIKEINLNDNLENFKTHKFHLDRSFLNWIAFLAFHNKFLTWLFYLSPLSGPIHKILYLIKGKPKDYRGY